MEVLTGIDLVDLKDFEKAYSNGGDNFVKRVFLPEETKRKEIEHLAGIFASKEAIMKALSIGPGNWLEIQITNQEDGRPKAHLSQKILSMINPKSSDLSISHTDNAAVAVFIALI